MVFHASAVEIAGSALAFVAESSRGKSTLAASFAAAGSPMLTDESLVVDERASAYWVEPGHASVRLWDDSEQALIAPGVETAPGLPFTPKRRFLAAPELRFSDRPAPLRRVYFLGDGSAPTVKFEQMDAVDVMLELLKASFLLNVDDKPRLASHFDEVARLARRPIHYRLDFPRRFDLLPSVRQSIIEHAAGRSRRPVRGEVAPMSYSIRDYGTMMADEVRTNAYAEALRTGRPAGRRRAGSRRGYGNLFPARVQVRRPARSRRRRERGGAHRA